MSILLIAASLWPRARSSLVSSSWPGVGGGGTAFTATGFFFRFFAGFLFAAAGFGAAAGFVFGDSAVGAARATPSGH